MDLCGAFPPAVERLSDLLVTHLDLAVHHKSWETADKVGALTLCTVDERVVHVLLLQVVLLLGAPRARIAAVHCDAWTLGRGVHWWRSWQTACVWGAWVGDIRALGAQPPLVDVKAKNADDDGECHAHNNRITIHIYCTE